MGPLDWKLKCQFQEGAVHGGEHEMTEDLGLNSCTDDAFYRQIKGRAYKSQSTAFFN